MSAEVLWRDGHPTQRLLLLLAGGDITMPELVRFNKHMVVCVDCFEAWRELFGVAFSTTRMDAK